MYNFDSIMEKLDWHAPASIQEEGRFMAEKISNISVFIQPMDSKYNKNVWENCAIVLSKKDDRTLAPYLTELLMWLQDLNWPGAVCILERMKSFTGDDFKNALQKCISQAKENGDEIWLNTLLEIQE